MLCSCDGVTTSPLDNKGQETLLSLASTCSKLVVFSGSGLSASSGESETSCCPQLLYAQLSKPPCLIYVWHRLLRDAPFLLLLVLMDFSLHGQPWDATTGYMSQDEYVLQHRKSLLSCSQWTSGMSKQ